MPFPSIVILSEVKDHVFLRPQAIISRTVKLETSSSFRYPSPVMATTNRPQNTPFLSHGMPAVLAMSAALLVLHCYLNNQYDFFCDEFNYLACARHLGWGYVDQPPLIPWLTRLSLVTLGDSLRALRFLPALFMSLT